MKSLVRKAFFAILLWPVLTAGSCATTGEPRIITRDVMVPVHQPCTIPEPAKPDFADDDEDLRAAPDFFTRVKLMAAGRLQRMGYEGELLAWGRACAK